MDEQSVVRKKPYLEDRRNFIRVATLGFGVPFCLFLLWMFGRFGGAGWWFFLVGLAFAISYIWARVMWIVFKNAYSIQEPRDNQK